MRYRFGKFEVRKCNRGYEIVQHDANASAVYPVIDMKNMWFNVEPFDSFIKAVRFLRCNHEDLI